MDHCDKPQKEIGLPDAKVAYREPSMLERLYKQRSHLENQLESTCIAIKLLRDNPELESVTRQLMRGGAY